MPTGGKEALLKFIESGKGFVGFHCATDTFGKHAGGGNNDNADPYIKMVGGEFDGHGKQQKAEDPRVVAAASRPLKDDARTSSCTRSGTRSATSPPTCT